MLHFCGECWTAADRHPERCDRGCEHWPPLCCPGCLCGSYEEAHGLVTPFDALELGDATSAGG